MSGAVNPERSIGGARSSLVRQVNQVAVLARLRDSGSMTVPELARALRTSRPTVDAVLASLRADGWVREHPGSSSSRRQGRPAKTYEFAAERHLVAAIDLGGSRLRVRIADLLGTSRADVSTAVPRNATRADVQRIALEGFAHAVDEIGVEADDIAIVVAGTPGIVAPDGQRVLSARTTHSGLTVDDLPGGEGSIKLLANDVGLAAVAEARVASDPSRRDLLFVLVGERMGTGLVLDGRLRVGAHGAAGEIGILASVGWHDVYHRLLALAGNRPDRITRIIARALASGDPLFREFLRALAIGVTASTLTIDPDTVVLASDEDTPEDLLAALRIELGAVSEVPIDLRGSRLGADRVCVGGVHTALTMLDAVLFQPTDMSLEGPLVLK